MSYNPQNNPIILTASGAGPFTPVTSKGYTNEIAASTAAAVAVTLPAGANGHSVIVKDATGAGASANNITITPNGADTIDGAATLVINVDRASFTLVKNGTNWDIVLGRWSNLHMSYEGQPIPSYSAGFSPVDLVLNGGGVSTAQLDDTTSGRRWGYDLGGVGFRVSGARFVWPGALGALSVKVQLWDSAGVLLATVTVAVNAAGLYDAIFGTPFLMTTAHAYENLVVSMYVIGGVYNINAPTNFGFFGESPFGPWMASPHLWLDKNVDAGLAGGDAYPQFQNDGTPIPIEPIIIAAP
jgi:hypothetical protein